MVAAALALLMITFTPKSDRTHRLPWAVGQPEKMRRNFKSVPDYRLLRIILNISMYSASLRYLDPVVFVARNANRNGCIGEVRSQTAL